jgi:hypothetical protein
MRYVYPLSPDPENQSLNTATLYWISKRPGVPLGGRSVALSQAFSIIYENLDFEKKPILYLQLRIPTIDNIILTPHTV